MMVGPQGHAVGVEHIPELVASSISNIEKSAAAALLKGGCLSVHAGGTSFRTHILPNEEKKKFPFFFVTLPNDNSLL